MKYVDLGILKDNLKKFVYIPIFYTLSLFFMVPLKVLMLSQKSSADTNDFLALFSYNNFEINIILVISFSILTAILIFKTLEKSSQDESNKNYTLKKSVIYRTYILSAIFLLLVPVLIISTILIIFNFILPINAENCIYNIFLWCRYTILMELYILFICAFFSMLTSLKTLQSILTLAFLTLPSLMLPPIIKNLNYLIYSINLDARLIPYKLLPNTKLLAGLSFKGTIINFEILIFILLCISLYFLSLLLFTKRDPIRQSKTFYFKNFEFIFKYFNAIYGMFIGGSYFLSLTKNFSWFVSGILLGSFFAYYASEMLIKKSVWVTTAFKDYTFFAIIPLLFIGALYFDCTGYERRIPNLESIKEVEFFNNASYSEIPSNSHTYKELINIKNIIKFHKYIVDNRKNVKFTDSYILGSGNYYYTFIYTLKDGSKINRSYFIHNDDVGGYIKNIYESTEYKKLSFYILSTNAGDILNMNMDFNFNFKEIKTSVKTMDIPKIIKALKSDILALKYEDMVSNYTYSNCFGNIRFTIKYNKAKLQYHAKNSVVIEIPMMDYYKNLNKCLIEQGY